MAQGVYHYLAQAWKKPSREMLHDRLIEWRQGDALTVLEKPTRLDRARALGYKAKKGFVILRVRLLRGGRRRERYGTKGRKSRKQHIRKTLKMSYQWVAELRASKRYQNLEVLNSYFLAKDGKYFFYEVILIDPQRPEIKSDPVYSWISNPSHTGRAERGLTSAARKSRGLRRKGKDLKVRPSLRAWNRQGK